MYTKFKSKEDYFGGMAGIEEAEKFVESLPDEDAHVFACKCRILYHLEQGKDHKARIEKARTRGLHDFVYCSHCGAELSEAHWNYCPNCGYKIKYGYHLSYKV